MSLPEVLLWRLLRGSPNGLAFRKQHPIDPYIADFYCSAARLVIEVDGEVHDLGDRPARDEKRTEFLQSKGYQVMRIAARDILKDAVSVAEGVIAYAANPLHHAPHGSPPRPGEDLG